jgi:hypothetical protein
MKLFQWFQPWEVGVEQQTGVMSVQELEVMGMAVGLGEGLLQVEYF